MLQWFLAGKVQSYYVVINLHHPNTHFLMHQAAIQSVMDFSAGSCFTMILAATLMLLVRKKTSQLHVLSGVLFAYLTLMDVVLFVVYYVAGCKEVLAVRAVNLYQATVMPLAACVLYELTHPNALRMPHMLLHVAPFMMVLGAYLVTWSPLVYRCAMWAALAYGVMVIGCSAYGVKVYRRRLMQWSSYTEGLDLRWLRHIVWAFLGVLVVWVVASMCEPQWVAVLYNFSVGMLFFALAYCLVHQDVPDWASMMLTPDEQDQQQDVENAQSAYHFVEGFHRAFDEGRVYLDNHLTIAKLAESLGTNRTYLSNYINTELHCTFYEYVNRRRVEYAKGLLVERNDPLDVVAALSGFNSLSSFRRAFLTYEDMTPGQYRTGYGRG